MKPCLAKIGDQFLLGVTDTSFLKRIRQVGDSPIQNHHLEKKIIVDHCQPLRTIIDHH